MKKFELNPTTEQLRQWYNKIKNTTTKYHYDYNYNQTLNELRVITDDQTVIDFLETDMGLSGEDFIPDVYEEKTDEQIKTLIDTDGDTSKIRPERVSKIKGDIQSKKNQDEINENENKPNLISILLNTRANDKNRATLENMPFDKLSEHFNKIINKTNGG